MHHKLGRPIRAPRCSAVSRQRAADVSQKVMNQATPTVGSDFDDTSQCVGTIPSVYTAPLPLFGSPQIFRALWSSQAFDASYVQLTYIHTTQSSHRKHGNTHCILLAGHPFQLSLSIPSNSHSLRVFHPIFPFSLCCAPLYATDPKSSIDGSAIGVILSSNVYLLIFPILLRRLQEFLVSLSIAKVKEGFG